MSPIRFPTAEELDREYDRYEAEMAQRRRHPVPEVPREVDPATPPKTIADYVYCRQCGKRFDHANRTVARMSLGRHRKAEHPEQVEAG
jgi:hypothetical protein